MAAQNERPGFKAGAVAGYYWWPLAGTLALLVALQARVALPMSMAVHFVAFLIGAMIVANSVPGRTKGTLLYLLPVGSFYLFDHAVFLFLGDDWWHNLLLTCAASAGGGVGSLYWTKNQASLTEGGLSKDEISVARKEFQRTKIALVQASLKDDDWIGLRLKDMITYSAGRVDYYENLRHRHMTIGLGLMAAAGGFSGFLIRQGTQIPVLATLSFAGAVLALLVGGWLLTYEYNQSSRREYVYRNVVDIRSWYYRYNLPQGEKLAESKDPAELRNQIATTETNFRRFVERWVEFTSDKKLFLAEDLEQVFILQIIQNDKADTVKRMQRELVTWLRLFAVLAAIGIVAWSAMMIIK